MAGVLALVLLMLALVAAGLLVASRPRLPAPFGPARNGAVLSSRSGDIYLIDRATSQSRPISAGPEFDFGPTFSRDGTKFLFLRSAGPVTNPAMLTLFVANADGSGARAITPPTQSLDWFDWSPDGNRIAYMSTGKLWVVDLAGGEPKRLLGTGPAHFPTWLPPDGKEIVYRLESSSPAIFAIAPDGVGKPRQLSTTPANNQFDYQSIAVSPDGSHVTFTRWSDAERPQVFALEVASGQVKAFPTANGTSARGAAPYSPDGKLVAYARIDRDGTFQIVVANADGSGNERPLGPKKPGRVDGSEIDAAWAFTPDGTGLLVRYGTDDAGSTQLVPLDGSPGTDLGSGGFEFVDIQRLAP